MAITPQYVNLLLLIPKGIEVGVFLILVILLYKRLMSKPPEQRYILNKLFILAFIFWIIYMTCDMILYNLAAMPFYEENIDAGTQITGYPSEYPEVGVSQVLRDISMASAFAMCYAYLAASLVIRKSERWTHEHYFQNKPLNIIFIILVIILVAGDQIGVEKKGEEIWVREKWNSIEGAISLLIIIVILLVSAIFFFRTVLQMDKSDSTLRKKSQLIGIGILVMALGGLYWMILGVTTQSSDIDNLTLMWLTFVGHMIWCCSPILIYLGLKR